jgi:hypothetical protein
MIPEPSPYDPDDPDYDDDPGYLLPDRGYRNDRIDPLDPMEY